MVRQCKFLKTNEKCTANSLLNFDSKHALFVIPKVVTMLVTMPCSPLVVFLRLLSHQSHVANQINHTYTGKCFCDCAVRNNINDGLPLLYLYGISQAALIYAIILCFITYIFFYRRSMVYYRLSAICHSICHVLQLYPQYI